MDELTWAQVTSWRLARAGLAARRSASKLADTVSGMCGAHAQIMSSVPLALAARVSRLTQKRVDTALADERTLVKTWAMRGTLHVLASTDLPLYCAAQSARDQYMNPSFLKYFGLKREDMLAVLDAIPQALDGKILTRDELADELLRITKKRHLEERLRSGWGEMLKPAAFRGLLCFAPQEGRNVRFVRPDQWIGKWREYEVDDALTEIFRRFLTAYGPASRAELGRWWGVRSPEAGRVVALLEDELTEVSVDGGRRWLLTSDLRSIKRSRAVKGVRLLPSFDQILVMSAPHREAIVDPGFAGRIYRQRVAVWSLPAVLIDGRVRAAWKIERKTASTVIRVMPFAKLSRAQKADIDTEVGALGGILDGVECAIEQP